MICVNCQKRITDGSNFCYNCGAKQPPSPAFGSDWDAGGKKRRSLRRPGRLFRCRCHNPPHLLAAGIPVRGHRSIGLRHPVDRITDRADWRSPDVSSSGIATHHSLASFKRSLPARSMRCSALEPRLSSYASPRPARGIHGMEASWGRL